MPTQRTHASHTLDALTQLHAPTTAAVTATGVGTVVATARVIDFGGVVTPGGTQIGYTRAELVINVTAFDFTTADEQYQLLFQLSDDADADGGGFDSGDLVRLRAAVALGDLTTLFAGVDQDDASGALALGVMRIGVDNEYMGTLFRFARIVHVLAGTTPSLTYTAYLSRTL